MLTTFALTALLAGCTSGSDDPVADPTSSAPTTTATPRPDGDVSAIDVCATADDEAVERLLPAAEGEQGGTGGESFSSATCTWANGVDDEPYGSLTLTVEVALTPDETEQRDVLDAVCDDAPVGEDGPGELACTEVTEVAPGTGSELSLLAIDGAAVVDVLYVKATGGDVSTSDRADLEKLAADLLAVTPQP